MNIHFQVKNGLKSTELHTAGTWRPTQGHYRFTIISWPPCVADADIIFLPCGFFYLLSFFLA